MYVFNVISIGWYNQLGISLGTSSKYQEDQLSGFFSTTAPEDGCVFYTYFANRQQTNDTASLLTHLLANAYKSQEAGFVAIAVLPTH